MESAPGHRRDDQQRIAIVELGFQSVAGANVALAHEQVHVRPYLSASSQDAQARLGIPASKFLQRLGDAAGFDGDFLHAAGQRAQRVGKFDLDHCDFALESMNRVVRRDEIRCYHAFARVTVSTNRPFASRAGSRQVRTTRSSVGLAASIAVAAASAERLRRSSSTWLMTAQTSNGVVPWSK